MSERSEWERDALVWLAGRWLDARPAPDEPRLARASARFRGWLANQEAAAAAARVAALVERKLPAAGRGVRRVDRAPELVPPAAAGTLPEMIVAARGAPLAPLAELGVAAGTGRELFDEPCDAWVRLPEALPPSRYVALRVVGDSMTPLLHPADVVLVDLDGTVHPGSIAVARHPDHGYVVKRAGRVEPMGRMLLSLNPAYPPIVLTPEAGALLGPVVLRWCGHGFPKPGLATRS
jgi:hypothetical protein